MYEGEDVESGEKDGQQQAHASVLRPGLLSVQRDCADRISLPSAACKPSCDKFPLLSNFLQDFTVPLPERFIIGNNC